MPSGAISPGSRRPHGCEGSPTLKLRVQFPEGMIGVKPMPKAGGAPETVKGAYAGSYSRGGEPVTSGVPATAPGGSTG